MLKVRKGYVEAVKQMRRNLTTKVGIDGPSKDTTESGVASTEPEKQSTPDEDSGSSSSKRRQFLRATGLGLGAAALPVMASPVSADHRYEITLGENERIQHANFGRSLRDIDDGIRLADGHANTNTIDNQAKSLVEVSGGTGSVRYICDMGLNFYAVGDNPMTAEVSTRGRLEGLLRSPLFANTRVVLFLRVRNRNTKEFVSENIFQRVIDGEVYDTQEYDRGFTGSTNFEIVPGDNHITWIRLVARIGVTQEDLSVLPLSDFGSPGREAVFDHIDFTFDS